MKYHSWTVIRLGAESLLRSCSQPGPLGRSIPGGHAPARSLFGLAPDGACHASLVAKAAVGSYPTVSPLPLMSGAVCSLWRCPSGCPGRALPGVIAPMEPGLSSRFASRDRPALRTREGLADCVARRQSAAEKGKRDASSWASPISIASSGPAAAPGRCRNRNAARRHAMDCSGS